MSAEPVKRAEKYWKAHEFPSGLGMVQMAGTESSVSTPQHLRCSLVVPEEAKAESACVCLFVSNTLIVCQYLWWGKSCSQNPFIESSWSLRNGPSLFTVSKEPNLHWCHCKCIRQMTVVMMTLRHVSDEEKVVFHLNGGERTLGGWFLLVDGYRPRTSARGYCCRWAVLVN